MLNRNQNNSPYNRSNLQKSKSQSKFSFPKEKRFGDIDIGQNTEFNFPNSSFRNDRATGLGYGEKLDLSSDKQLTKNSFINQSLKGSFQNHKGQDFGTPRSKMHNTIPNNMTPDKKINVGPGDQEHDTYKNESRFRKSPTGYSKWSQKRFVVHQPVVPGPQHQEIEGMNETGNQFQSSFKSSGATKFNPKRSASNERGRMSPAPDTYKIPDLTNNKNGFIQEGKQRSSGPGSFGKSVRASLVNTNKTPGPGAQSTRFTDFN